MIDKPKVLFVAHNSVFSPSFGGVEAYINTLTKYLKSEYDVYWYVPYNGDDGVGVQLIGPDKQSVKKILLKTPFENWQLSCPERESTFIKVLQDLDIGLVHFHHLIGHPPSLMKVAKGNGAHTVFTFHDYFSLCHVSNLVNFEGKYCHPDSIPLSSCDECLQKKYSILPGSQQIRREYWDELFQYVDGLIFNTQGGLDLVSKIYPSVASHSNVAILPVAIEEVVRPKLPPRTRDVLRVAILGNLNHHKGADVIVETIKQLENENISFHFFGEIEKSYDDKLASIGNPKVYRYGRYPSGDLPKELFLCDVSLHASIWPETYVLALSEAWAAGLVPIVSDVGALGERVVEGVNGIKVDVGSSAALTNAILRVRSGLNTQLRAGIKDSPIPISWMKGHAKQLIDDYKMISMAKAITVEQTIFVDPKSSGFPITWARFAQSALKGAGGQNLLTKGKGLLVWLSKR